VSSNDRVRISIVDNSIGIPAENVTRIFNHGFKTKKDGHGFGLHSGALTAKELGGTLTAYSEGLGRGSNVTWIEDFPGSKPTIKQKLMRFGCCF
jgi:two-component system, NtrC family, sensor kinase